MVFLVVAITALSFQPKAYALTANKVWYERHDGFIRILVEYTIPELKQIREAKVEFKDVQKASKFYWSLIRGADFYPWQPGEKNIYIQVKKKPTPW